MRFGTIVARRFDNSPWNRRLHMYMRRVTTEDAERIAEIYNWYILNTIITFETDVVSPQEMKKRIQEKIIQHDWLVGEANQEVIGYAYYGPFRPRSAYHDTVESTIYVSPASVGKGFGRVPSRAIC